MSEYEILKNKIEDSKKIVIEEVNDKKIDNIDLIKINRKNSRNIRIVNFIKETKNPYCFLVDDMVVKIEYSNNNKRIGQCISNLITNKIIW